MADISKTVAVIFEGVNNTGAALEAGLAQGAATALMDWAWWAPTLVGTGV